MNSSHRILELVVVLLLSPALFACGSDDSSAVTDDATPEAQSDGDTDEASVEDDADHSDEAAGEEDDHSEEAASGLGAHEHGAAELMVAWTGRDMVIDLISPAINIFGFEYEPVSEDDVALVAERTEALSNPAAVAINDEAGCELVDEVRTEFEVEGSHAEVTASWILACDNPEEIRQLDAAMLFAEFPNLEDIDVQWASEATQSSAELSPSAPVLDFG